eukprot:scaffold89824_cov42-Phaeocystis_antarctica.AAC.1
MYKKILRNASPRSRTDEGGPFSALPPFRAWPITGSPGMAISPLSVRARLEAGAPRACARLDPSVDARAPRCETDLWKGVSMTHVTAPGPGFFKKRPRAV